MYNCLMAKIATGLEDIGDERDQAVFMAAVKLWYNGDFQVALDEYNAIQAELDELDAEIDARDRPNHNSAKAEVRIMFPHQ